MGLVAPVSCAHCQFFIKDLIGSGQGVGNCFHLVDYKNRGASQKQMEKAYRALGNKLFWGSDDGVIDRYCVKYNSK